METITWEAPGPGVWEAETAHMPKPVPRLGRPEFIAGFVEGFKESTGRYGLLLSHLQPAVVNDFFFMQPVPFGAPPGAKGPPPAPVMWLLARLHPGMRGRIAETRKAFEERRWRADLRRWDEEDKPAALARHRAMLAVDLAALDDAALAAHGREVVDHMGAMVRLHHRYTVTCMLPVGDLLAHVAAWTGETPKAVLQLLRGSTPVSKGILASELEALVAALRSDSEATGILSGRDPGSVIAALMARPGPVGTAATAFFEGVRHRAISYEIGAKAAGEMPEMLVASVRAALRGDAATQKDDSAARTAALRARVPAEHQAEFDSLVEEARFINRLRDERGVYADGFAVGIGRRYALEVGRRLAARGELVDAEDAVDLDVGELQALLTGKPGPSASEVRGRVEYRRTKSVEDIPLYLGGEPSGPPDPGLLPRFGKRGAEAIGAAMGSLFGQTDFTSTNDVVRGLSVNDGVYEGTARIIKDPSEFGRLQSGDVLVTRATAPYFNVVLPLLGAIVTDRGGELCHAAIVAREYGIPGVVGTKEATTRIPDGARVRVDGTTGEVTILARPD